MTAGSAVATWLACRWALARARKAPFLICPGAADVSLEWVFKSPLGHVFEFIP